MANGQNQDQEQQLRTAPLLSQDRRNRLLEVIRGSGPRTIISGFRGTVGEELAKDDARRAARARAQAQAEGGAPSQVALGDVQRTLTTTGVQQPAPGGRTLPGQAVVPGGPQQPGGDFLGQFRQLLPAARQITGLDERGQPLDRARLLQEQQRGREPIEAEFAGRLARERVAGRQRERGLGAIIGAASGRNLNTFAQNQMNNLRQENQARLNALEQQRSSALQSFDVQAAERVEKRIDKELDRQDRARTQLFGFINTVIQQQQQQEQFAGQAAAAEQAQTFKQLIELEELGLEKSNIQSIIKDRDARRDLAQSQFGLDVAEFEQSDRKLKADQGLAERKFQEDRRRFDTKTALSNLENSGFTLDPEGNVTPTLKKLQFEFEKSVTERKLPLELANIRSQIASRNQQLAAQAATTQVSEEDIQSEFDAVLRGVKKLDKVPKNVRDTVQDMITNEVQKLEELQRIETGEGEIIGPIEQEQFIPPKEREVLEQFQESLRRKQLGVTTEETGSLEDVLGQFGL